jgi:hypothetical protein
MDCEGDRPHHRRRRCLRGGTPRAPLGFPPHLRCRHLQDLPLHRQLLRARHSGNRARWPGTVHSDISAFDRAVPTPPPRRRRNQPRLHDYDPMVVVTPADPPRAESRSPGRPLRRWPRRRLQLRGDTHQSGRKSARKRPLDRVPASLDPSRALALTGSERIPGARGTPASASWSGSTGSTPVHIWSSSVAVTVRCLRGGDRFGSWVSRKVVVGDGER